MFRFTALMLLVLTIGCTPHCSKKRRNFSEFQKSAEKFNSVLSLPNFEQSPEAVEKSVKAAIEKGNKALDKIGKQPLDRVTFESTIQAMEFAVADVIRVLSRIYLLSETSPNAALRKKANEMVKFAEKWSVDVQYREDLYKTVKALEKKKPELTGESKKLYEETLRDYRRAGLHLSKSKREDIKKIKKQLAEITNEFRENVNQSKAVIEFTKAEMKGVPADFLEKSEIKDKNGHYRINSQIYWEYASVAKHAVSEDVRKRVFEKRYSRLVEKNIPLFRRVLVLRADLSKKLGLPTWAHHVLEVKMAKNPETVFGFLNQLSQGLAPLFKKEVKEYQLLKARDLKNATVKVFPWDTPYYNNRIKKERYQVDQEALKVYFPLDETLKGMFEIYQEIFGLEFHEIDPPYKWENSVRLFVATDRKTNEPLGAFYLDLFPRDGKYGHFAMFDVVDPGRLADGKYQRPVVALVCNFPPPSKDKPSLLLHTHVETLFHEFGHAMHEVLTRAEYPSFAGTSVPRDFVEAPSQMLENWVWDKNVLDRFAADYRDKNKKFPSEILKQMKKAKKAGTGGDNRFQIALGMMDMRFHSLRAGQRSVDPHQIGLKTLDEFYLAYPPTTSRAAGFNHLVGGYDAGYYGYLWSKAISEDMASVFEKSPKGFLDVETGMRLRKEIYEAGHSRDVDVSIRKFLGRERSLKPFLEELGIQ